MCVDCGGTADTCVCIPSKEISDQGSIPSVFFYDPNANDAKCRIIYNIKRTKNKEMFDFAALEISHSLLRLLKDRELLPHDCIFTWIPRSKKAALKYGVDQGKKLCISLSKALGGEYAPLFIRKGGAKQKSLDKKGRIDNIKSSVFLNSTLKGFKRGGKHGSIEALVENRTVIIVDDVITTGATVSHGIKLLRTVGTGAVIVCCVARTSRNYKK